jgi:hypothetical protein
MLVVNLDDAPVGELGLRTFQNEVRDWRWRIRVDHIGIFTPFFIFQIRGQKTIDLPGYEFFPASFSFDLGVSDSRLTS